MSALTDKLARLGYSATPMECLLLLVDEMDDLVSVILLHWVGIRRSVALMMFGVLGAAALVGAMAIGLGPLSLCIAAAGCSAVLATACRSSIAGRLPLGADRTD